MKRCLLCGYTPVPRSGASILPSVPKVKAWVREVLREGIQAARHGLLKMQSIPREQCKTFRGVTGFLDEEFSKQKMGMDFAFFSTSTDRKVAEDFARSAEMWVLFEVQYVAACRGVDVKSLSVYPGEKEVLFPPCTALNKVGSGSAETTGIVTVSPIAATQSS